jgi:hypothetical protein
VTVYSLTSTITNVQKEGNAMRKHDIYRREEAAEVMLMLK